MPKACESSRAFSNERIAQSGSAGQLLLMEITVAGSNPVTLSTKKELFN